MINAPRLACRHLCVVLLAIAAVGDAASAEPRTLSLDERIAAQRAIEDVYWRHRVWPKDNPGPKPSRASVVPDSAIREKVEDYLRKSSAMKRWWQRPVTGEQLQAELNRMSKESRDPAMLRELYTALGNDAFVIAETLARPALVDRMVRNWYAADARFHGALKGRVERSVARIRSVDRMRTSDGDYVETGIVLQEKSRSYDGHRFDRPIEVDAAEWRDYQSGLAERFGTEWERIPVQRLSPLREEPDRFSVTALLSREPTAVVVASVVWPKTSFDTWWSRARRGMTTDVAAPRQPYTLAAAPGGVCTDDTWDIRVYTPNRRSFNTAVWTGTEMIVWGGFGSDGSRLNSGGCYNPATDTWTPTSTGAKVPSGRTYHTAVWTGTEMMVWGGQGGGNSGGRYRPSTDSWIETSVENAPSGRYAHTAVWTGSEMIVWGGANAGVTGVATIPSRTVGLRPPRAPTCPRLESNRLPFGPEPR